MNPDAEADLTVFGQRLASCSESLLDLYSGLDRLHDARELRQDAVSSRIGDPASMLADEPVHDLPVSREGPQGPDLVRLHQPRIALHVCSKDGCETPLNLRTSGHVS
jgi:hypothetical protein